MFENGYIAFNDTSSEIHRLTISSEPIRAVISAALSTIVSYQLAAALTDLYFGCKPPFLSTAQNIQIFIQTRRSSIQPLYNALFRGSTEESKSKLKPTVVLTLFLLLLLAPLVNIGAIFLTTEYDTFLTFEEAKFGGIALSINNSMAKTDQPSLITIAQCRLVPVKLDKFEYALADFFICLSSPNTTTWSPVPNKAAVAVCTRGNYRVSVYLRNPHVQHILIFESSFYVNDLTEQGNASAYALPTSVKENEITELAEYIMKKISSSCGTDFSTRKKANAEDLGISGDNIRSFDGFTNECKQNGFNDSFLTDLEANITSRVSFISTGKLDAYRDDDTYPGPEIDEDVSKNLFLRRRYIHANATVFAMVAVATVAFRLLINLVTRNDVSKGMGLLVRDALSLPCIDSMLQRRDMFTW